MAKTRKRMKAPGASTGGSATSRRNILLVAGAAIIVTAILIGVALATTGGDGPATVVNPDLVQGRTLGLPDAPIEIVDYSDFSCPACRALSENAAPRIIEKYVEPGAARFVFKHMAILGDASVRAHVAAECANEQNMFWPYHDRLFAEQGSQGPDTFSDSNLKRWAQELGLNTSQFNECLDSRKYLDLVLQETAQGRDRGVNSTPTVFVDGVPIRGAAPFETFQQAIEAALQ